MSNEHKRTEIRNKTFDMLTADISGVNIYNSRIYEIPENKLPAISVYTPGDTGEKDASETNYRRLNEVHIVLYVTGKSPPEELETGETYIDELSDNYLKEIEDIFLTKWQTLEKVVYRLNYVSTSIMPDKESEYLLLIADTIWEARVHQAVT